MDIKVKNLTKPQAFNLFLHFTGMAVVIPGVEKEMAPAGLKFVLELNKGMNDILRTVAVKHLRKKLEFMSDYQFKDVLLDSGLHLLLPYVQSVKSSSGYTKEESDYLIKLSNYEKRNN